ncbi:hypothetical protein NFI96_027741 [Prochilodus magdalenae]|nr:hypothetical protein NFI96_027741 [Prochilodus magdalenae]
MDSSSTDILGDVQKLHKEGLRNCVLNSLQTSSPLGGQSIKELIVNKCYTPLSTCVSEEASLEESEKWETLEAVISREFAAGQEGRRILLCGGAGMGKTTAVEQLTWDWATDSRLQHYALLLPVCVKTLCKSDQSLESLLLSTHAHLSAEALMLALQRPKSLLLVLDGLDYLLFESSPSDMLVSDPQQPAGGTVLLHSLLEGSLLPGVSVLLTCREAVPLESVQCVHLLGFSKAQRGVFFQQFFNKEAEAEQQVLHCCKQAVGVAELSRCPAFCWMLCCVCKEHEPETLTMVCCAVTFTLLQEHRINVEAGRQLLCGLGKLADLCNSQAHTHCSTAEVIACGLQPFLGSSVLSAFLHISGDDVMSPDTTFSFLSPIFQEFLLAVFFYIDQSAVQAGQDEGRILEEGPDLYQMFLAGLSDPLQRKLLEASIGQLSSSRLSEFHQWLINLVKEVLPGFEKEKHWHVFRLLHHARSPTLVKESVGACEWRTLSYAGLQVPDCAALAFAVRCLGEIENLNLYFSKLTEEQAQKLVPAFCLAKSIDLSQSCLDSGVIMHLARALTDGQTTLLDLSSSKIGVEAMKNLFPSFTHSNLHTLCLRSCNLTPACGEVLGKMLSGSKLCVLNLRANELQDQGLAQLISALGTSGCKLQDLSLDYCSLSGGCVAVLSSAISSSLTELKRLNLSWNELAEDTLELFLQALQTGRSSLNALELFDCQLTDSCCPSIAAILQLPNCSLTELDLSVNELGEAGALLICDALRSPKCPLEKLCMCRCELTEQVFSSLGTVLVSGTSRLKELAIGINTVVGDAGAKHIWKALKHTHCILQHLDLEMISLTDNCVDELCEAVAASTSLTTLILKNNGLTDASVPQLVKLAQDRPIIKELNLQENDFSEDVFELMDTCPNIQY